MKTKVIGYVRVSTEGQADEGVSLAAQKAKLEAYAVAMDLELIGVETDAGRSARTVEGRPGLLRALALLDAGTATGLLVVKLDRLTRSVRDLGDLVERYFASKCSLMSVSDSIDTRTAAGRLVLNVLASVAQWEREATAERVREILSYLRSTGVLIGGVPLGRRRTAEIDRDGRRVVVEDEAEMLAVRRAIELRATGSSLRQIAATLRAEGHPTKRGGRWEATTVGRVLARATVATA
jgi:DNA invertase Pin-like site-specific DNA recombinase